MGLLDKVSSAVSSAKQKIQDTASEVKTAASNAAGEVKEAAGAAVDKASSVATEVKQAASTAVSEVRQTVVSAESKAGAMAKHAHDASAGLLQKAVLAKMPGSGAAQVEAKTPATTGAIASGPAAPAQAGEVKNIRTGTPEEQKAAKQALVAGAPQVNDVSVMNGNSQHVCGASAQLNALVLNETPDGKNAAALAKTVEDAKGKGLQVSPDEQKALDAFKAGSLTPENMQQLQQVTYRLARGTDKATSDGPPNKPYDVPPNITPGGLETAMKKKGTTPTPEQSAALDRLKSKTASPADVATLTGLARSTGILRADQEPAKNDLDLNPQHMGALTAQLKANGAFSNGENVTFNLSKAESPPPAKEKYNHWTVTTAGVHANSMQADEKTGPAQLSDKIPKDLRTNPGSPNWRGEVSLQQDKNPPTLTVDYRVSKDEDRKYQRVEVPVNGNNPAEWKKATFDDLKYAGQDTGDGNIAKQVKTRNGLDEQNDGEKFLKDMDNKDVSSWSIDDDTRARVNKDPTVLRYATTDQKVHLLKGLKDGYTSDDDQKAIDNIMKSATTDDERRKLDAALNG